MRRVHLLAFAFAAAAALVVVSPGSGPAEAAACPSSPIMWTAGDGDWSNGANWSTPAPPTAADNACIPAGVTVTINGNAEARELVSDGAITVPGGSSLALNDSSSVAAADHAGVLSVNAGDLTIDFTHLRDGATVHAEAGTTIAVNGTTTLTDGTISFTGAGATAVNGRLTADSPTTIQALGSEVWLGNCSRRCAGGSLYGETAGISLYGDFALPPNGGLFGVIDNYGTITAPPGGERSDDWHAIVGNFTNHGTFTWNSDISVGTADHLGNSSIVNNGTIEVLDDMRLVDFQLGGTFVNNGEITIAGGGRLSTEGFEATNSLSGIVTVDDGGVFLAGYSSRGGDYGSLTNAGHIVLGPEPASGFFPTLEVGTDFTHTATGTITFAIAGAAADTAHGTLGVGGAATLDGAIVAERVGDYDPPLGEVYPLVTYGSHTGDFGGLTGLDPWWTGNVGPLVTTVTRATPPDSSTAATGTAAPGGVVGTDQAVTPGNPLATSVETPTGGLVSIVEESPVPASPPFGYSVLGTEFSRITAPDATAGDPLILTFTIDATVWDGIPLGSLDISRNGDVVLDCTDPGGSPAAAPDPCVASRSGTPGSPAVIVVRTSQASDWVLLRPDNQPPVCDVATPSVATLWSPNHKLRSVGINGVGDPDGDPVTITIESIFQDEPVNGADDGNTAPDAFGVGTASAELRAERADNADGRVYHITFSAQDTNGGSCTGEVTVSVPKNKKRPAVDGGPLHDSTTEE